MGHSRLGKTACGPALDQRFAMVLSNCSEKGSFYHATELWGDYKQSCQRVPYWFCGNFQKYAACDQLPVDAHE
jgi:hypothetical protein